LVKALFKFFVWMTLILGGIVAVLRATCMRFWTMPNDDPLLSLSVTPTLEPGDVLVLWRIGAPTFGELVRCPDPESPGRFIVGRLLGEPGDKVVADLANVTVNNRFIGSRRACNPPQLTVFDPNTGEAFDLSCEVEEAGGIEYTRARATNPPAHPPETFRVKVPDGSVFLASDNRHYHDDSRDFGPVAKASCKERIVYRLWSARGWFDERRRMMLIH
jgi:signal peptidase I